MSKEYQLTPSERVGVAWVNRPPANGGRCVDVAMRVLRPLYVMGSGRSIGAAGGFAAPHRLTASEYRHAHLR
jgi:hypothetical protein